MIRFLLSAEGKSGISDVIRSSNPGEINHADEYHLWEVAAK